MKTLFLNVQHHNFQKLSFYELNEDENSIDYLAICKKYLNLSSAEIATSCTLLKMTLQCSLYKASYRLYTKGKAPKEIAEKCKTTRTQFVHWFITSIISYTEVVVDEGGDY